VLAEEAVAKMENCFLFCTTFLSEIILLFDIFYEKSIDFWFSLMYNISMVQKKGESMEKKMGRPPKPNSNTVGLTVKINAESMKKLEIYCDREHISKGEAVRRMIDSVSTKK